MITGLVSIIHNKPTALANRAQITFFSNQSTINPNERYYTINGINVDHQIKYLQIIPQGVAIPTNLNLLNSTNLYFGADQLSNDRRFYNVSVKMGNKLGAQVVIIIIDHTLITLNDFRDAMQEISGPKLLVQRPWGFVVETKIFQKIFARMTETGMTFAQALAELKQKILSRGYTHG